MSDRILFYSKSPNYVFNRLRVDFSKEYKDSKFTHYEADGRRFRLSDLNPPAGRGPVYEYHGITRPWRCTKEKMLKLEAEGRIYTESKIPQLKRYLHELAGQAIPDIWSDISLINSRAKERLGYPTQKPVPLLRRVISASSNEGDVVLDPFCGCGTALVAAHELKRRWIGIDITYLAVFLIEQRLKDSFGESIKGTYRIYGNPEDVESAQALWSKSPKEFELWALRLVDARPRPQDGGVDGVLGFVDEGRQTKRIIVQVKGGEHLAPTIIRDLKGTIGDEKAVMGLLITLHPVTSGMMESAIHAGSYCSPLWNRSFPLIQVRTIHELLIEHKGFDLPPQVTMLKQAERIKEQGTLDRML